MMNDDIGKIAHVLAEMSKEYTPEQFAPHIALELRSLVSQAYEEAAGDVCRWCANGFEAHRRITSWDYSIPGGYPFAWEHNVVDAARPDAQTRIRCEAHNIHERIRALKDSLAAEPVPST